MKKRNEERALKAATMKAVAGHWKKSCWKIQNFEVEKKHITILYFEIWIKMLWNQICWVFFYRQIWIANKLASIFCSNLIYQSLVLKLKYYRLSSSNEMKSICDEVLIFSEKSWKIEKPCRRHKVKRGDKTKTIFFSSMFGTYLIFFIILILPTFALQIEVFNIK